MFDIIAFVEAAGYLGLFAIVFAECGLLVGAIFPGDSLLFTAGLLASRGYLNVVILIPLLFVAAVAGDNVGYWIGKKSGPRVFTREESFFFHKDHAERARRFFEEHGAKSIVLARFVPIVRTFVPVLAGVGKMDYRTFFRFNLIGGALWSAGITLAGFFLGNVVPDIDAYLLPIVGAVVLISFYPLISHVFVSVRRK